MKNLRFIAVCVGLILCVGMMNLSAQEITTMQFMKGLPQSDLLNPALHNDSSKIVIGIPGLSGMNYDFNSGFAVNDLIHKGTGLLADSLVLDMDKFQNSLKPTNTVKQQLNLPLFYVGFRVKKSYFSINITEKVVANFSFDKSLFTFLKDGNGSYMGKTQDLGDLKLDAFDYREFALGYSTDLVDNRLTLGLKAKLLFGKAAIQTERMNLKVETAADGSYLNLNSDMKINASLPVTLEYDKDGYFTGMNGDNIEPADYMFQNGNKGFAFDIGAVYKLTPKLVLSGSIVDIGKISFTKDLINLKHVSSYKWEGIDFSNSVNEAGSNYVNPSDLVDAELNKLKDTFKPKKSEFSSEEFSMNIPTKIYLGGTYAINNHFNVGLLDRIYKSGSISLNTITLSANAMFGNFFGLTGSYSMIGQAYNNLGLGFTLRMGFLQLYVVDDNVLAFANPAKAEVANIRFGLNFLFGRNKL